MLDFKLEPLTYLEETVGPTVRVRVQNLEFEVPAGWQVLAVDRENYVIDCISIPAVATFNHDILLFSPSDSKPVLTQMTIIDYKPRASVIHPMVPKGSAMVHPTGPEISHGKSIFYGVVIGPHDLYRWVGDRTVGDILT